MVAPHLSHEKAYVKGPTWRPLRETLLPVAILPFALTPLPVGCILMSVSIRGAANLKHDLGRIRIKRCVAVPDGTRYGSVRVRLSSSHPVPSTRSVSLLRQPSAAEC